MLKAMTKSLGKKHLNPEFLDPLNPFSKLLAEGVGFEPTEHLRVHRFSRPAP